MLVNKGEFQQFGGHSDKVELRRCQFTASGRCSTLQQLGKPRGGMVSSHRSHQKQNLKLPTDDLVVAGVMCAGQIQQTGCDKNKYGHLVK